MFNDLPLFQDAKKQISSLKPAIAEIGDIICKKNLEKFIGVNLLHRHFSLDSNEILVKTVFDDYAEIVPSPSENKAHCAPYLFKAEKNGFESTEYISSNSQFFSNVADSQKIILDDLAEVHETIKRLGVSEKLGIFIMHQPFDTHPNMGWVEDSSNNRTLRITKQSVSDIETSGATETNWFFKKKDSGSSDMNVGVLCGICCVIHCGIHCGWHGDIRNEK